MKKNGNTHKENAPQENAPKAGNPPQQEIEHRAYQLYQERGGDDGHDCEDWLQAECDLKESGQVAMSH